MARFFNEHLFTMENSRNFEGPVLQCLPVCDRLQFVDFGLLFVVCYAKFSVSGTDNFSKR